MQERLAVYKQQLEENPSRLRTIARKMNESSDVEGLYRLLDVSEGGLGAFRFFMGEFIPGEQTMYGATEFLTIRTALEVLQPQATDVFMDLGSGEGGVVFYSALTTDMQCVGIEIVKNRAKKANDIKERFDIENATFISGKVQDQDLSKGTIFFMYDALSDQTLAKVREKLQSVASTKPISVIFRWILRERLRSFQEEDWLKQLKDPRIDKHLNLAIFTSIP